MELSFCGLYKINLTWLNDMEGVSVAWMDGWMDEWLNEWMYACPRFPREPFIRSTPHWAGVLLRTQGSGSGVDVERVHRSITPHNKRFKWGHGGVLSPASVWCVHLHAIIFIIGSGSTEFCSENIYTEGILLFSFLIDPFMLFGPSKAKIVV